VAAHAEHIRRYIARFPAERYPDPFLSAFTRECIERARDVNAGGAQFARFHGIAFMGLATTVDSLSALRTHVFEGPVGLEEMREALRADFAGRQALRARLLHRTPHYGNDRPEVDAHARWIVEACSEACLAQRLAGGGRFVPCFAANVQNICAGAETGATPDGRGAGEPLSDAASPFFGRDRRGATAFLASVAWPDYRLAPGGSVVNIKFDPEHFQGEEGARAFEAITRAFVTRRMQELQVNFTSQRDLEAALRDPDAHRNLVVRVSGFSAYFTQLAPEVQRDVVRRRSHGAP
jgi:formate C-acetyltransferase